MFCLYCTVFIWIKYILNRTGTSWWVVIGAFSGIKTRLKHINQCSGSATFWDRSGSWSGSLDPYTGLLIWIRILLFLPTVENKVFHNLFCWWKDPDLDGPETYGSGSLSRVRIRNADTNHSHYCMLTHSGVGGEALGPELASWPLLGIHLLHDPLLQDPHRPRPEQEGSGIRHRLSVNRYLQFLGCQCSGSVTFLVRIRIHIRGSISLITDSILLYLAFNTSK